VRPVLLCASTRDGEEALILGAMKAAPLNDALIVIVPRHPQRFDEVARLIASYGFAMVRRSSDGAGAVPSGVKVFLGDSMGEMFAYYAACDVAFIGGSLLPLGGQNLIEACALGKPVLIGPHTFNFGPISEDAIAAGAALRVANAVAMLDNAMYLLQSDDVCMDMGVRARAFSQQHRGATGRTVSLLQALIK
jgi:3-deoxy-D-manno-octulosonic-acid transferase